MKRCTLFLLLLLPLKLMATEAGLGRPITGQQVVPYMGALPFEAGWIVSFSSIYYDGQFSNTEKAPIIGSIAEGLDTKVWYNLFTIKRAWDSFTPKVTFASSFGVPIQYSQISATLQPPRANVGNADNSIQAGDLFIDFLTVAYHISSYHHVSFSIPVYVPTGSYSQERLANAGQNTFTFVPTLAYTFYRPDIGFEFTPTMAFEFYTKNPATQYTNGTLFRLESLVSMKVIEKWRVGFVGGYIEQISDDQGELADLLNGFRGRSVGFGPFLGWAKRIGDNENDLDVNFRWVPEVTTRNRPKGNGMQLRVTYSF